MVSVLHPYVMLPCQENIEQDKQDTQFTFLTKEQFAHVFVYKTSHSKHLSH